LEGKNRLFNREKPKIKRDSSDIRGRIETPPPPPRKVGNIRKLEEKKRIAKKKRNTLNFRGKTKEKNNGNEITVKKGNWTPSNQERYCRKESEVSLLQNTGPRN